MKKRYACAVVTPDTPLRERELREMEILAIDIAELFLRIGTFTPRR